MSSPDSPGGAGTSGVECPACKAVMPEDVLVCPSCSHLRSQTAYETAEQAKQFKLEPGVLFAERYNMEGPVGSGGMATVWRAMDTVLEETVAIKFLRFEGKEDIEEYLKRFRSEIRLARRIHHPGIVANYDMGEWQGRPYMTMEYVTGTDLSQVIRREHPLPLDRIVKWLTEIGIALAAAHAEGIVHRDLKSSNIIIDQNDQARILDFGIARQLLDPRQTLTGRVVGTPLYIAPEAAMEKPDVDHRSDIYSYGVLAYEMCTANFPFKDKNPVKILLAHIQEKPAPPGYHREDLPGDLEETILRCMEKDPEQRYQKISDAVDDLKHSLVLRNTTSSMRAISASGTANAVPRVLVVDDDGTLRLLLKTLFEGAGLSVDVVPDAELAIERMEAGPYDLLVTDLVLPGKSGHDLAAWVQQRSDDQRMPVVVMTSLEEDETRARSTALGVAGHLTKPLSIDEFTQLVQRFFPEHAPRDG